jgi:hypothetical protein
MRFQCLLGGARPRWGFGQLQQRGEEGRGVRRGALWPPWAGERDACTWEAQKNNGLVSKILGGGLQLNATGLWSFGFIGEKHAWVPPPRRAGRVWRRAGAAQDEARGRKTARGPPPPRGAQPGLALPTAAGARPSKRSGRLERAAAQGK